MQTKYHYVYRITNKILNKHYYGKRSSIIEPKKDLGIIYFSSSTDKIFMEDQKLNSQNYKYKIIKVFELRIEASLYEIMLHNKFKVDSNINFYNKSKAKLNAKDFENQVLVEYNNKLFLVSKDDPRYLSGEFPAFSKNKISVKDKHNNKFYIKNDDPRYLSGELVSIHKNKILMKDNENRKYFLSKDDPRYLSGELVSIHKNMVLVEDSSGKFEKTTRDDPRYLSGELLPFSKNKKAMQNANGDIFYLNVNDLKIIEENLFHVNKNKALYYDENDLIMIDTTEAKNRNLKAFSKDKVVAKDKEGNCFRIETNDPRYLSGELVHVHRGLILVKDELGNMLKVKKDDPRYLSGELVHNTKDMIPVRNKDNERFFVHKNDPRYLSGELYSINKNMIKVRDKNGKGLSVDKNDPRYLSGELVHINKGKKLKSGRFMIHNELTKKKKFIYIGDMIPDGWIKGSPK